jgi:hypothetical protein
MGRAAFDLQERWVRFSRHSIGTGPCPETGMGLNQPNPGALPAPQLWTITLRAGPIVIATRRRMLRADT